MYVADQAPEADDTAATLGVTSLRKAGADCLLGGVHHTLSNDLFHVAVLKSRCAQVACAPRKVNKRFRLRDLCFAHVDHFRT